MKRTLLLLAIFLAAVPSRADLVGQWRNTRAILLPPLTTSGLVYLPLDEDALAAVDSFAEYRVVRAGGIETPYRMLEERGQTETYLLPAQMVAQSPPGADPEEITLALGGRPASRLRLKLELIGRDFRCRAELAGSQDGNQWQVISDRETLLRQDSGVEQRELAVPFRADRFLRLRLFPEQGRLPRIERVAVSSETLVARRLLPVPAHLSRTEDAQQRRTILTLDTGRNTRDLAEVGFDVEDAAFDRMATLESREPGGAWVNRSVERLQRLAGEELVTLPLDIPRAQELRVSLNNGDDAPLHIRRVMLRRLRRGLLFLAAPGQTYALWYGHPNAVAPAYEMERLPLTTPPEELPQVSLGAERALPLLPPAPLPWSEQHPWLFWGVLGVVVALLLLLILRSMRGVQGLTLFSEENGKDPTRHEP